MPPKTAIAYRQIRNAKISDSLLRMNTNRTIGNAVNAVANAVASASDDLDNFQDDQLNQYDETSVASTLPSEDGLIDNSDNEEDEQYNNVGNGIAAIQHRTIGNDNLAIYKRIFEWFVQERNRLAGRIPRDANVLLYDGAEISKREFATGLFETFVQHNISQPGQAALLDLMRSAFPFATIPMHISKAENVVSDLHLYAEQSTRLLTISICPENSCCAFFGDLEGEVYCPTCAAERFTHCAHVSCRGRAYNECTKHTLANRTPKKTMHYRPLLGMIVELLETELFLDCLNWVRVKDGDEETISDVMDGANPKKHLREMHNNYMQQPGVGPSGVVEVNLLLSLFYDGAQVSLLVYMMTVLWKTYLFKYFIVQVYKTTCNTFWPLFCSILNLPPSLRNKIGVGQFLIALYTGALGKGAEAYLLEDLFLGELLAFEKGQLLAVDNRKYFVQIRLIQHCLDTKALGKMLNVQEANSLAGCPLCDDFPGVYRSSLSKVVNGQHRQMLPLTSALRILGNSEMCCPPNYYKGSEDECMADMVRVTKLKEDNPLKPVFCKIVNSFKKKVQHNQPRDGLELLNWSCELPADEVTDLAQRLRTLKPIWYHAVPGVANHPHAFNNIVQSLHYVHMDLREEKPFRKITMEQFVERGRLAVDTKKVQLGVKGEWPYSQLRYADIQSDVNYDPFHAISGVCLQLLKNLKGARLNAKIFAYCQQNNVHPSMHHEPEAISSSSGTSSANSKQKKKHQGIKLHGFFHLQTKPRLTRT